MLVKTADLTGRGLRWAVGLAINYSFKDLDVLTQRGFEDWSALARANGRGLPSFESNFEYAGRLIERDKISIEWTGAEWLARVYDVEKVLQSQAMPEYKGTTYLEAAMRALVAHNLGEEVEIPAEVLAPRKPY